MPYLASMLQRIQHSNGVVTLASPKLSALGIPHGFSTRHGGISRSPFDSLNLGLLHKAVPTAIGAKPTPPAKDPNTSVAENFRRLRAALGLEGHLRVAAPQVHGGDVWQAPEAPVLFADAPHCDGVVTTHRRHMLVCRTADCVPVLLAFSDGSAVAVAHAGWRGIVAGVVPHTINQMHAAGRESPEVIAAVGPCIGSAKFEVGPEVAEAFASSGLESAIIAPEGAHEKHHIDLSAAVTGQLADCGVRSIECADQCTYEHANDFFSYRRDGATSGRMAAVIARP